MAFRILAANPCQPWPLVIMFMEKLEEHLKRLADDFSSRRLSSRRITMATRDLCFTRWGQFLGWLPPDLVDSSDSDDEVDSSDERLTGNFLLDTARLYEYDRVRRPSPPDLSEWFSATPPPWMVRHNRCYEAGRRLG
jgi:hypothetical protein